MSDMKMGKKRSKEVQEASGGHFGAVWKDGGVVMPTGPFHTSVFRPGLHSQVPQQLRVQVPQQR